MIKIKKKTKCSQIYSVNLSVVKLTCAQRLLKKSHFLSFFLTRAGRKFKNERVHLRPVKCDSQP